MKSLILFLLLFVPIFSIQASEELPAIALVQATEQGQGVLFKYRDDCYAVIPTHVLANDIFASLHGSSKKAGMGDADLIESFGYDLSLMYLSGSLSKSCQYRYNRHIDLNRLLSESAHATISTVNEDQTVSRRNVRVDDTGLLYLRVTPTREMDQLYKGLSGSLVTIEGQAVGMLMKVDPETGAGSVLRFDRIVETLAPYFSNSQYSNVKASPEQTQVSSQKLKGFKVTEWSAPATGAALRAGNLSDSSSDTLWRAEFTKRPIYIVLQSDKPEVVTSVDIDGTRVNLEAELPKDIEILSSSSDDGGWNAVKTITFLKNKKHATVILAPIRAKRIMLRIYSNWGSSEAVSLNQLTIQ